MIMLIDGEPLRDERVNFVSLHVHVQGNSDQWCSDLLKASEEFLSQVTLKQDFVNEELLTRHLFTVGEVAQVCSSVALCGSSF